MKVLYKTASLLLLACLLLTLSACGSSNTPSDAESPDPAPEETQEETLETLCGEDYVTYIVDTITMQMENRMEKTPEAVSYTHLISALWLTSMQARPPRPSESCSTPA